jgi:hypothetical protein
MTWNSKLTLKSLQNRNINAPMVGVRMPIDEIEHVDKWREDQPDKPSRPVAIRRLVRIALRHAKSNV